MDDLSFQWTSGEQKFHSVADQKSFNLNIGLPGVKEGDKVKITFGSYKVTLGGFSQGTTFDKWTAKVNLVYNVDKKWPLIVSDSNDRINKPFTNGNNNPSDSLVNYSFTTVIPKGKCFTITVAPQGFEFNNINGHNRPMFTHGYGTITTSIRGLKVEML